jgi:hypothetical protein
MVNGGDFKFEDLRFERREEQGDCEKWEECEGWIPGFTGLKPRC